MRDPEHCRIKHTEEQTGWSLFFINNADGSKVSSSFRFFVVIGKIFRDLQ